MSTITTLMHWWSNLSDDNRIITSWSSPIVDTHVLSSWMIYEVFLLHWALIFFTMLSDMTLTEAPESTKLLWTLKFIISNDNRKCGYSDFSSSTRSMLRTNVSVLGDLLVPLLEEVASPVEVYPSAQRRRSRWLMILVNLYRDIFARVFFMSSTKL